jgi:hypothetical protein
LPADVNAGARIDAGAAAWENADMKRRATLKDVAAAAS